MSFRIKGLAAEPFLDLFDLDDTALAARDMRRVIADAPHAAPCRVTLEDAVPGERLILLPFSHQTAHSPYQASGPIFVREAARNAFDQIGTLPPVFEGRVLSVRAYDAEGLMTAADLADSDPRALFEAFFADPAVDHIHVHYAKRGCFACRVTRA
jgi:uncharacterized protein DUF1203